jgi:hypothetical protein
MVAERDFVFFACAVADKPFNLARSNQCSPNGSTRRVTYRARFTHEALMVFPKHNVAAVSTAKL